jgi:hypothetical protein
MIITVVLGAGSITGQLPIPEALHAALAALKAGICLRLLGPLLSGP